MMNQVIGVIGFIGSGKDTVGQMLLDSKYNYHQESFAGTLKDATAKLFGWDREMLEGKTEWARAAREVEDKWWSERLGIKATPRYILQYMGTEVIRTTLHDDFWIFALERRLLQSKSNIVITDVRFPNEIAFLKKIGGKIVRVHRGPEPSWYEDAVAANKNLAEGLAADVTNLAGVHRSEWAWVGSKFDYRIANDGSLDDLKMRVDNMLADIHYIPD